MSHSEKAQISRRPVYRTVRFPGITSFARENGYNYVSVYRHLTGERPSKTIARKWAAWKARKTA